MRSAQTPLASDEQAGALLRARLVGVGNIDKLCCGVALDVALLRVLRVLGVWLRVLRVLRV